MKYGWVNKNIVDIWNRPKYNSERVNQALFCDIITFNSERSGFLKVQKEDGYPGWIDKRFVTSCTKKDTREFNKKRNFVVTAKTAKIYASSNIKLPSMILYGTKLYKVKERKNQILFKTVTDSRFCLTRSKVKPIRNTKNNLHREFVIEAKRFLDIPYFWGGISSFGFDCSGLVQTILGRFGINIPRDTKDQIKFGKRVEPENIRTGDLMFFNRHVGFAIGRKRIIHSSIGGNGVQVNSLDPADNDFRKDLKDTFKQARRII